MKISDLIDKLIDIQNTYDDQAEIIIVGEVELNVSEGDVSNCVQIEQYVTDLTYNNGEVRIIGQEIK